MSEVIFKCPGCSKNLSAGDAAIGRSFDCPTCQNKVTLPEPDFIFNCPLCKAELSTQKSMVGETFNCPSCEQGFTIPSTGKMFISTLKQKPITITCPSCSVEMELESDYYKEVVGKSIDCPECKKAISIPTASVPKKIPVNIPIPLPTIPRCPGCKEEMPKDAVICVSCGLDLRTGHKLVSEPEPKRSRLQFKIPDSQPIEQLNPIFSRYALPKAPTIFDKLLPALKTAALLLVIAGMGLLVVRYVDVPSVVNKAKSMWVSFSSTNTATQVVSTTQVASTNKPPELKVANGILHILETLRAKPGDYAALQDLSVNIKNLTDTNDNRYIKCGMMTVFALGQLGKGNEQSGLSCFDHIQNNFADTEFVGMVNKANFYDTCPKCAAKGELKENCKVCNGGTKCKACGGLGTTQVAGKAAPQGLSKLSKKGRALGPPPPASPQTVTVSCSSCDGSGKCSSCKGVGFFASKCSDCNGAGKILAKVKVKAQYDIALTKTMDKVSSRIKEGRDLAISENTKVAEVANDVDLSVLKDMLVNGKKISLFDGLIRISDEKKLPLSIDPETVRMMTGVYVDISSLSSVTNTASLNDFVAKYHLIVKPVVASLESSNNVNFVTSPSVWIYSQACWYLLRNQVAQAQQILATASIESSVFGGHCEEIKSLLKAVNEKKAELSVIASGLRESLAKYKQNAASAQTFSTASQTGLKGGHIGSDDGIFAAAAQTNYKKARDAAFSSVELLRSYLRQMESCNVRVFGRINTTYDSNLRSEAYFLLNFLIDNYSTLKGLQKDVQESGLKGIPGDLDKLIGSFPDQIKEWQSALGAGIHASSVDIEKLHISLSSEQGASEGFRVSSDAYTLDRANFMARVGAGYFTVVQNTKAFKDTLFVDKLTEDQQKDMVREFNRKNKTGLMQAFNDVAGKNLPVMSDAATKKLGSVAGLAVCVAQGEIFPLSVKIQPRGITTTIHEQAYVGYWGFYMSRYITQKRDFPISFGDYGDKDFNMWVSTIEVYKWLVNQFPTEMAGNGLHVEFRDLMTNKGGDSAGVTMGVAAYSYINKIPIRRDVAMTGSIRSDGSVLPVGAVFNKISGAQGCDGIELVIIPKANEADALFVPVDQLCRISIVSADDIQTYINYATKPDYKKDALHNLHRAQMFILMGDRKKAEDILLSVAANNPEIYSARRLLELLAINRKQN